MHCKKSVGIGGITLFPIKKIYARRKDTGKQLKIDLINFSEGLLLSDWQWIPLNDVELLVKND